MEKQQDVDDIIVSNDYTENVPLQPAMLSTANVHRARHNCPLKVTSVIESNPHQAIWYVKSEFRFGTLKVKKI